MTLLVASINAAPTMNSDPRFKTAGKWVEPCGISPLVSAPSVNDAQRLTDEELLSPIVVNTKLAIVHAEIFKELFVSICTVNILYSFRFAMTNVSVAQLS